MDVITPCFQSLRSVDGLVDVCLGGDIPHAEIWVNDARCGGADAVGDVVAAFEVGAYKEGNRELAGGEDLAGGGGETVGDVHLRDHVDELALPGGREDERLGIDLYICGVRTHLKAMYYGQSLRSAKPL